MKEMLVILPYLAEEQEGREIKYAVQGWKKHCKFPYRLIVVGDDFEGRPADVGYIRCPKVHSDRYPGQYVPHIDTAHKLCVAHDYFPDATECIVTWDDIYAVHDFSLDDVKTIRHRGTSIYGSAVAENDFLADGFRDRKILQSEGFSDMEYTCHIPKYVVWNRMENIFHNYHCLEESHNWFNLYFNVYQCGKRYPTAEKVNGRYQANFPVLSKLTEEEVADGAKDAIWVFNSDGAWSEGLENYLIHHYGD